MIRTSRFTIHALLVMTCGVAGYIAGSQEGSTSSAQRLQKWKAAPRGTDDPRPRRTEDPVLEFSRILRGEGQRTDLLSVISRIPVARMPEAAEMLRGIAEVDKRLIVGVNEWNDMAAWNEIANALYFHWAELDPHAALADAMAFSSEQRRKEAVSGVLTAWMRTDPDAAYRAVKDDQKVGYLARDMIVRAWTQENVFGNADRYPENRGDLLGWYAIGHIGDPARRDAMLEELRSRKDLKERSWVYSLLFRSWGYRNFGEAMAAATREKIPWLEKQLLDDNLQGPRAGQIFKWAADNHRLPSGPQWEKGYGTWLMTGQEDARKWFAEHSPKWIQDGRNDMVAGFLAADLTYSRDAVGAENTAASRALIRHWQAWSAAEPQAAERWLSTASPNVVAALRKGDVP